MKVETTRFGTIEVDEKKTIRMPFGMPGFPDMKRFVMFPHRDNSPFFWYQSVEDSKLAFVIISPFLIIPDYKVDMEDVLKEMSWNEERENNHFELYVIVNIPKGSPQRMTANLIGPLLINSGTRQAVQMVISNSPYSHKFPLLKDNANR